MPEVVATDRTTHEDLKQEINAEIGPSCDHSPRRDLLTGFLSDAGGSV